MKPRLTQLKPRVPMLGDRLPTLTPGSWRTSDMTTAQRGYGAAWQRARLAHLRAPSLCVMCLAETPSRITAATICDHSQAHRGDMAIFWDSSKWQSLCQSHHSSEAQRRDNAAKE